MKKTLSIIDPQLAAQWHPTKNGGSLQNKWQQAQQKKLGGNVLMGFTTNGQLLLQENPQEWAHHHTLYQESRKDWAVIPYEEMIRWCQQRSDYTIGDFGCGEAKLAEAVSDRHTVYSFDHIAINNNAIACDALIPGQFHNTRRIQNHYNCILKNSTTCHC
jgi:hypothetical protein